MTDIDEAPEFEDADSDEEIDLMNEEYREADEEEL